MQVSERLVQEIIPYENNPRNNDEAVDKVAESIREFGFQQPIVIDKDGVVIVGHTRLKAAKKLGLETVPVVMADNLTDEQAKAYRLADNKTNEFAEWDIDALDIELLDTFGGSGSTLMACEQTNRRCFMIELDPHYCDVIIERWETFTGRKAELLNG